MGLFWSLLVRQPIARQDLGGRVETGWMRGGDSQSHQPDVEKAAWRVQSEGNQATRKNVD